MTGCRDTTTSNNLTRTVSRDTEKFLDVADVSDLFAQVADELSSRLACRLRGTYICALRGGPRGECSAFSGVDEKVSITYV
jgi:hypothetical protein